VIDNPLSERDTEYMTFTPTSEQQDIIDAFLTGGNMVVEAGAGTGKTSTLKLLAAAKPSERGVYLAYNKSIQTEAEQSFPSTVQCRTAHSFAFREFGVKFKHRLNGPRITSRDVANILGITQGIGSDDTYLNQTKLARLVMDTVRNFCYSDYDTPSKYQVPHVPGTEDYRDDLVAMIVPLAVKAWADICNQNGRLKFEHDHYLKMWALSEPVLEVGDNGFVMLDEAQDANPVIAQVVNSQPCQKIMVGDRCQAIYGWRGAVDAMSDFECDHRLMLSKSFRFGKEVADIANIWLTALDAPLRLEGHDPIPSKVGSFTDAKGVAILCRTNAGVLQEALFAQESGKQAAIVGGSAAIKAFSEAAVDLMGGRSTWHPELSAFKTWGDVQVYAGTDEGADLRVMVRLIDSYGPHRLIQVADSTVGEDKADVVCSTAHKAKGREWNQVRICDDFRKSDVAGADNQMSRPDMMLAYVSVTRAQLQLDPGALASPPPKLVYDTNMRNL
jgi:superfamily I DNA/RNA helicase